MGGDWARGGTQSVEVYLPEEDKWQPRADLPIAANACAVTAADGHIYVLLFGKVNK